MVVLPLPQDSIVLSITGRDQEKEEESVEVEMKDLIDFSKDTGLQSSAAATRNATIKLIGALHRFVGPDIKGFLADVQPALLSALDAEYEKNPFEGVAAAAKKTVRASDANVLASKF